LAQRFQRMARKFGQFVQEQNALMRKRDFAGFGVRTACEYSLTMRLAS
jgi:hypothetical protein